MKPPLPKLSPREIQICRLLILDLHDCEIAERLKIAVPTLRTHLLRAQYKTGARSRLSLALWFDRHLSSKTMTSRTTTFARRTAA